ncbi:MULTISPECIES: group II intron reverse transcriptase/maturase [Planktothricoides]|uniref:Group II intron reverse transcriptase/maturase n=1 Tax=Planktothricoides raciborskii FACHB-1370 TaxID=2949576 RepID=A0ABR8EIM7_9CYAN|nr:MULTISPECIES: group II intron reverse transcriptase/maturase [Planktothricoides]KOR36861.1 DNA polymerase [Planktothricoides sp. SR001]MBD2546322.1 group II intron reverse transcriptase/maturase [Planktothricoides raciborskii FACHB-1370]MBD2584695.1 group II intron reverse transcriptase/maturase [Planktothricoides raciborskii FACHB-1261]
MSKTRQKLMVEWNEIPWKIIQRKVFKLQKRIYRAASRGNDVLAKGLQKLLLKSYYAKLLAVRQVTQLNRGKKTAGVDGIKSLTPVQRLSLASRLSLTYKAKAVRRVWIPKPGRDEKRPLGIPTVEDRARQALVKMALEPYWESQFEETSYGFRPGRSTHDAVARIYLVINKKPNYVLDADISKCFDKINHTYLLKKLQCPAKVRHQVKTWLKAGIMDGGAFEKPEAGTPQGGVISPLLANIALDGMIRDVESQFPMYYYSKKGLYTPPVRIIRYADDFVVLHPELEVIHKAKAAIEAWLKPVGLELKPEKTRICHTLNQLVTGSELTVTPGFDFLGFNIRQYPVGKHKSGKNPQGKLLGYKTLIKPSKKAIKAHHVALKEVIKTHKTAPQAGLIGRLNPMIKGWANYYSGVAAKETFSSEDMVLWQMLRAWSVSRRGRKQKAQAIRKYYRKGRHGTWTFATADGLTLWKHQDVEIKRHTLVKPDKSPYDGDWVYWSTRRGQDIEAPTRVAKLLKKQKGKCPYCGQYFTSSDLLEVDHIIPKSQGGKDEYKNLQLLHAHCHDLKSRYDGSTQGHQEEELPLW